MQPNAQKTAAPVPSPLQAIFSGPAQSGTQPIDAAKKATLDSIFNTGGGSGPAPADTSKLDAIFKPAPKVDSSLLSFNNGPDSVFADTPQAKAAREGTVGHVGPEIQKSFAARRSAIDETTKAYSDGKIGLAQAFVNNVGQVLGGAFDIPMDVVKAMTPEPVKEAVGGAVAKGLDVLSGPIADALAKPEIATYQNAAEMTRHAGDLYSQANKTDDPAAKQKLLSLAKSTSDAANAIKQNADDISTSYGENAKTGEAVANAGMLVVGALGEPAPSADVLDNVKTGTANRLAQYDTLIKSGDATAADVYSDPASGTFKPDVAEQIVQDAHDNLVRLGKPDLAAELKSSVDTASMTKDSMTSALDDVLSPKGGTLGMEADAGPEAGAAAAKAPVDDSAVLDRYNRAIKPGVAGRANAGQIADSNARVVTGLKAIAENKAGLEFTDSEGEVVKGETPRTVDQLSQAIAQTKAAIFDKYDALARAAGDQGVTIEGPEIAKELDSVVNSKSLQLVNPRAIQYAQDLQARLTKMGPIDAKTAQDVIQHYNASLKAFYRNPTYDTASQAAIDATVANQMRAKLDAGITGATGEQYGALKSQYGALASMEKDVARRAMVWGRQNAGGSLASNISNFASGAELVRGLVTMNPADIAVSGTLKGIQMYMKYLNNPDVGVVKIFDQLNSAGPDASGASLPGGTNTPGGTTPPARAPVLDKTSPKPIIQAPKSQTIAEANAGKIPTQGGKVVNPLAALFKRMSPAERGTVSDLTDFAAGDYKPDAQTAHRLQIDAAEIAQKYGIKEYKSLSSLANQFGRILDAGNYKANKS